MDHRYYVDGRLREGVHSLQCTDQSGRSFRVQVRVEHQGPGQVEVSVRRNSTEEIYWWFANQPQFFIKKKRLNHGKIRIAEYDFTPSLIDELTASFFSKNSNPAKESKVEQ